MLLRINLKPIKKYEDDGGVNIGKKIGSFNNMLGDRGKARILFKKFFWLCRKIK